jgi:CRISPR-associated endonuclease/helicase Cas3
MLTDATSFFGRYFSLLTGGKSPYAWQSALFAQMIAGDIPDSLDLPTGAGKTSIIPIWLLALAWCAINPGSPAIPRRLVWVVNRRVVVDQATAEAKELLEALEHSDCDTVRDALIAMSGDRPLAVSALRGELADNGDWKRNPAVPAIIIGTVDMIGSRMLFRGYGDSRYYRPYHAGLLGVDALIVNDEAHLTPAFARLLLEIRKQDPARATPFRFRLMLVSATDQRLGSHPFVHPIETDAASDERFRRIFEAEKRLHLHSASDTQAAQALLVSLAVTDPAPRTILFIESPAKALDVLRQIKKKVGGRRVALLTGTMRGIERDSLADHDPVFQAFQARALPSEPLFLVATSAAEVGVNVTSERLVTLLQTADHLLQRFGRLNRFGDQDGEAHRVGTAHVVSIDPLPKDPDGRLAQTLAYLRGLPSPEGDWFDISCRAVRGVPVPHEARDADPPMAALHPWHLDVWAQTSIDAPVIPKVQHWLHGKEDTDRPETTIAWRAEVKYLATEGIDPEELARALASYPVLAKEQLREPTDEVTKKLEQMRQDEPVLLVSPDGRVKATDIAGLLGPDLDLEFSLILLPPKTGRLERGMWGPEPAEDPGNDIADSAGEKLRRRYSATKVDDTWQWAPIAFAEHETEWPDPTDAEALRKFADARGLGKPTVIEIPRPEAEDEAPPQLLILFASQPERQYERGKLELAVHTDAAVRIAAEIGGKLFSGPETEWLTQAARLHDQGKIHLLWRRAMGCEGDPPMAKVIRARNPRLLEGFRHELCSLVRVEEPVCDLVLHLVASHHGRARPNFECKAYDQEKLRPSEDAALETARRFAALQKQYGHWGLAYLEAVFKAIDGMASEGRNA